MSRISDRLRSPSRGLILAATVRDERTFSPVVGATVRLPFGTPREAVTRDDGRFGIAGVRAGQHHLVVSADGFKTRELDRTIPPGDLPDILLTRVGPPRPRRGRVRSDGRLLVDDHGAFNPLGGSQFNLPAIFRNDRQRALAILAYWRGHGVDSIRMFSCVFENEAHGVDPRWPDYDQVLAELFELTYDTYGMRTELCVFGTYYLNATESWLNYDAHIARIAGIIEGREHKVWLAELHNEAYHLYPDLTKLEAHTRLLAARTSILIATSDNMQTASGADTNQPQRGLMTRAWGATALTLHAARSGSACGWAQATLPFREWAFISMPVTNSEPPCTTTSGTQEYDPEKLVTARAFGIAYGVSGFNVMGGSMVDGVARTPDEGDHQHVANPANPWEEQNIDAICEALRRLDALLPERAAGGIPYNMAEASPLRVMETWEHGGETGPYAAVLSDLGDEFFAVLAGIRGHVTIDVHRGCRFRVVHPVSGETSGPHTLASGQLLNLDADGTRILVGEWTEHANSDGIDRPTLDSDDETWERFFAALVDKHHLHGVAVESGLYALQTDWSITGGRIQHDSAGVLRARVYFPARPEDHDDFARYRNVQADWRLTRT